jgi:hypothetical protein
MQRRRVQNGPLGPHLEHFDTALKVGRADVDDAVEAAGADERRIQHILAIACRHHDHLSVHHKLLRIGLKFSSFYSCIHA